MSPQFAITSQPYLTVEQLAMQVGPQYFLPGMAVAIAIVLVLLLRVPVLVTGVVLGLAVLFLPSILPISSGVISEHPLLPAISALTIGALLAASIGVGRLVSKAMKVGSGSLTNLFTLVLVLALAFISILFFRPELLRNGEGSVATLLLPVLLSLSVMGVLIACFRFIRAGTVLLLWSGVCIMLGSEFFLGKAPADLLPSRMAEFSSFVPEWKVSEYLSSGALKKTADSIKVLLVDPRVEKIRTAVDGTLPQLLEYELREAVPEKIFEVETIGGFELSSFSQLELLKRVLPEASADVVVFGDWSVDKERGTNGFGIFGISEEEGISLREARLKTAKIPGVQAIYESSLRRLFITPSSHQASDELPLRVSPQAYEEHLKQMIAVSKKAGTTPVLFRKPNFRSEQEDTGYIQAFQKIANEREISNVLGQEAFKGREYELLFETQEKLSLHGKGQFARKLSVAVLQALENTPDLEETGVSRITTATTTSQLKNELKVDVQPTNSNGFYRILFGANGKFVEDKRFSGADLTSMTFPIDDALRNHRFTELSVRGVRESGFSRSKIGGSNFHFNGALKIATAAEFDEIQLDGRLRHRLNRDYPLTGVRLDIQLGHVQELEPFSSAEEAARWLRKTPWGTGVALISRNPGDNWNDQSFLKALRYVGLSGLSLNRANCIGLGVAGMSPAPGAVTCSQEAVTLQVGDNQEIDLRMVLKGLPNYS